MDQSTKPIHVYRGKYIESAHDVHIAVVSAKGDLLAYYGDPVRQTFARSSMKPFQALPVVETGAMEAYNLTERELSLFCASHIGEPYHRESVMEVLGKINLPEDKLQCGTHIPKDTESYKRLVQSGGELTPVYSNCSGKHSGMLAGVAQQGMDVDTYHELSHPYQQQIIDGIANVSGYEREKIMTSVDGCGLPVHRMPLYYNALMFARLAAPDKWTDGTSERQSALGRIRDAMTSYPEMVAGTDQFDTDLMKAYEGRIVAKGGAEAVHCFGDRETGIGVALKISDGNPRATTAASMEVLQQLGIGNEKIFADLDDYHYVPVKNMRKEKIGEVKPVFKLNRI
ncbi:asparaginase [Lentibacillus sp. JNUCC-1]|uniref:asparaginase n=1 Tax=Lentibacillus sp. JNUCC-1 TaxID=2654513 RepID=UPI0012E79646|nr:asparaginase [Lentibacillus sp. JNUCC-1]